MFLRVPIAHIHGGEITEGAYDDAMRHAITKLSYLHFTSTEEHRRRVIQLGESPERVYNTGAIGLDHLERTKLMELHELSESLEFDLSTPYFLVTYHPVTLVSEPPTKIFEELLAALDQFPNFKVIVTYPNADDGGRELIPLIERYASLNTDRVLAIPSLGQIRYLSAVKFASAVIGNSSSGIIEVPSFNVPSINIGLRQYGRTAAKSVYHSDGSESSIKHAIAVALKEPLLNVLNPYGKGDVSGQVLNVLRGMQFSIMKKFHDLD
jgi:UDP-N-acetylglucosamine 2-epimerase (non-hydrolysing)